MYGFDSTLVLFAMGATNVRYPSVILSSTQSGNNEHRPSKIGDNLLD